MKLVIPAIDWALYIIPGETYDQTLSPFLPGLYQTIAMQFNERIVIAQPPLWST